MYFVVARKYDSEIKKIDYYIIGLFGSYCEASIFTNAYNEYYKSDAKIISGYNLLNINK